LSTRRIARRADSATHRAVSHRVRSIVAIFAMAIAAGAACNFSQDLGGFDPAKPDGGSVSDGGTDSALPSTDATTPDSGRTGPNGAGPFGALPSGYCCTSDDECRFRKCADFGGGKMCIDLCSASRPGVCRRPGLDFTCGAFAGGEYCQPPGGFTCLDPQLFVRGTQTTGACCTDTMDGRTGSECEANLCLAIGTKPWFCTRQCDAGTDCPSNFQCYPVGNRKECVPLDVNYICK
jgi:hypothetical protein